MPSRPAPAALDRDHFRPDIEGLRGVAVLAVVLFHAWPGILGGGFIGVDVFFVISGFLITGLLYRELGRRGRISFGAFYVRRVRRLFPAAALAIGATFVLSAVLLSPLALPRVSADGVAAALSVANVRFAFASGDYFTAVATPSPFLHFWSLSVEEQFYLVWPATLLLLFRFGGARLVALGIGVVCALSLVLAVFMTDVAAAWAFYSLPTRAWQLALGGLLAIAALSRFRRRPVAGALALLGWLGLAMIAAAAIGFDEQLAYPGAWALLPTVGAALVIAGGDRRAGPGLLLGTPPVRFLGRISYALYLWHWPLLVLPAVAYGAELPLGATLALVLLAVSVATLSTLLVEEPIRRRTRPLPGWRAAGMAARPLLGLALAVVIGAGTTHWVTSAAIAETGLDGGTAAADGQPPRPQDVEGDVVIEGLDDLRDRPARPRATARPERSGAPRATARPTAEARAAATPEPRAEATTALAEETAEPARTPRPKPSAKPTATPRPRKTPDPDRTPKPTPVVQLPKDVQPSVWDAPDDVEFLKRNGCLHREELSRPSRCVFGKAGSDFSIALVGDSHASHWFPALQRVAARQGWRLETYVKVSCPFTDILVRNLELKRRYHECLAFNQNTVAALKQSKPDLVVTALSRWQHPVDGAYDSPWAQGEGIARMLRQVPGRKVVIADVPYPGQDVPECLARHPRDIRPCAVSDYNRSSGGSPARERQAASSSGGVMLNFGDLICGGSAGCPVVRNDMIVFRDHHHLTATFARSLAPALERALLKVMERKRR